jgi:hypothetical protein
LKVPVYFGDTIRKVLEQGRRILASSEVVLWAVMGDGQMIQLVNREADLMGVVETYPNLRVERAPDANSQTFLLIDADGQLVGPPFQYALAHGQTARELAARVRDYLNVAAALDIAFRTADGRITWPEIPAHEIPRGEFVVLAMTRS